MRFVLFVSLIAITFGAPAQTVTLLEGDLKFLRGQSTIPINFTYDSMLVEVNTPEDQFVTTRKAELEKKQAGFGVKWEKAWAEDRKWKLEPAFKNMFARTLKVSTIGKGQFIIIFQTTRTVPGWNSGLSIQKNSTIDGIATIVDANDSSKILARVEVLGMDGRGTIAQYAWETGDQIAQAYETAGRELALFIRSNIKK